jgi:hypothetical protein
MFLSLPRGGHVGCHSRMAAWQDGGAENSLAAAAHGPHQITSLDTGFPRVGPAKSRQGPVPFGEIDRWLPRPGFDRKGIGWDGGLFMTDFLPTRNEGSPLRLGFVNRCSIRFL